MFSIYENKASLVEYTTVIRHIRPQFTKQIFFTGLSLCAKPTLQSVTSDPQWFPSLYHEEAQRFPLCSPYLKHKHTLVEYTKLSVYKAPLVLFQLFSNRKLRSWGKK